MDPVSKMHLQSKMDLVFKMHLQSKMDLLFKTYPLSPALKRAARLIAHLTACKMLRRTPPGTRPRMSHGMSHRMLRKMSRKMSRMMLRRTWPAVPVGALVAH
jgi:hypothetical protein